MIAGDLVLDGSVAKSNLRTFRRKHNEFVFQKLNLILFFTAVENIIVLLELDGQTHRTAKRRAMELLDYLGVADRADNFPSMRSGGQQKRIAVARAITNRPSVIFADEPTAALDSHRGRQVMESLAQVAHEQNAGVIVVTHDRRA